MESRSLHRVGRGISRLFLSLTRTSIGNFLEGSVFRGFRSPAPLETLSNNLSMFVKDRPDAVKVAHDDSMRYRPGRLVLFSDASWGGDSPPAIAVSWKFGSGRNDWQSKHYSLPNHIDTNVCEFCGIIQALYIAAQICKSTRSARTAYDTVVIYTDSQHSIKYFNRYAELNTSHSPLFDANKLSIMIATLREAKVDLELHWCPGHSGIVGNEISNDVCIAARRERGQAMFTRLGVQAQIIKSVVTRAERLLVNTNLYENHVQNATGTSTAATKHIRLKMPTQSNHPVHNMAANQSDSNILQKLKAWLPQ